MRGPRRIPTYLGHYDMQLVELMLAGASLAMGVWLLIPLWSPFDGGTGWQALQALGGGRVWGAGFMVTGTLRAAALETDSVWGRRATAFVGMLLWTAVAASIVASDPAGAAERPSIPLYGLLGLASGWSFGRLMIGGEREGAADSV